LPIPGSLREKGSGWEVVKRVYEQIGDVPRKGVSFAGTDLVAARQALSSQEGAVLTTTYLKRRKKDLFELCSPEKVGFGSYHVQYLASVVITSARCHYKATTRATGPNWVVTIDAPTEEEFQTCGTPAFVTLTGASIGSLTPPAPPPRPAHADSAEEPGGDPGGSGPEGSGPGGGGLGAGALEDGGWRP